MPSDNLAAELLQFPLGELVGHILDYEETGDPMIVKVTRSTTQVPVLHQNRPRTCLDGLPTGNPLAKRARRGGRGRGLGRARGGPRGRAPGHGQLRVRRPRGPLVRGDARVTPEAMARSAGTYAQIVGRDQTGRRLVRAEAGGVLGGGELQRSERGRGHVRSRLGSDLV